MISAIYSVWSRVILVDGVVARLEQAKTFGVADVIDISTLTDPADRLAAVHDSSAERARTSGSKSRCYQAAFAEGLDLIRRGGRYLVMGHPFSPAARCPSTRGMPPARR